MRYMRYMNAVHAPFTMHAAAVADYSEYIAYMQLYGR